MVCKEESNPIANKKSTGAIFFISRDKTHTAATKNLFELTV